MFTKTKKIIILSSLLLLVNTCSLLAKQPSKKLSKQQRLLHRKSAELLLSSGAYSEAIKEYTLLSKYRWSKWNRTQLLIGKGICHKELNQYEQAIACFQEAIELTPKIWKSYLHLAKVFEKTGLNTEAIENYKKVIKLNGDKLETYSGLGRIYQKRGLNSQAIEYYQKVLMIKSDPVVYRNISKCYELRHEWALSCSMLKQSISFKPTTEDYVHLAFLYSLQNKYPESIESLSSALNREPNRADIMLHLAAANFKKGDHETAKNLLKVIVEMYPDNGLAHFMTGLILYFENELDKAKEEMNEANRLSKSLMLKQYSEHFLESLK